MEACIFAFHHAVTFELMFFNSANAKWPFSLSHNRMQTGVRARQQNSKVHPFRM